MGNVGTGFNQATLNELHQQLLKNKRRPNPFTTKLPGASQAHWVQPNLVGEVAFTEWTNDEYLRHPGFKGLRSDKIASEVMHEQVTSSKEVKIAKTVAKKQKRNLC
ncbi:hypothetical protein LDG_7000 [Legionella drancourtii LLAP12]|uniref:DNA ligase (ATP) n=1 Tax=Legionella drancourtii LLAP12 TaxID=658187 RepID=G9EP20_9GAMM|nr:hypothetical protein LDG_7000 [Legionella drancourtii LLAP12]